MQRIQFFLRAGMNLGAHCPLRRPFILVSFVSLYLFSFDVARPFGQDTTFVPVRLPSIDVCAMYLFITTQERRYSPLSQYCVTLAALSAS